MKIFDNKTYRELDQQSIDEGGEGISAVMEKAGKVFLEWFQENFKTDKKLLVFCGQGNNGADGLVFARMAKKAGYQVEAFVVHYKESTSPHYQEKERLLEAVDVPIVYLGPHNYDPDFPTLNENDIVVDCIFGTGLNYPVTSFIEEIIKWINASPSTVVSLDIPSGLFPDKHTEGTTIEARYTFGFDLPKLCYLMPENFKYVGDWEVRKMNIDQGKIAMKRTTQYLYDLENAFKTYKAHVRKKYDHKGKYGHALMIAGSLGMIGASVLATKATLRAGAGKVTAHVPQCGYKILQISAPEAIVSLDSNQTQFTKVPDNLDEFNVIGIGPGLGTSESTEKALGETLDKTKLPIVLDADAINLLAKQTNWLERLPENSIISPHPKEFQRLFPDAQGDDYKKLKLQQEMSAKYKIIIVQKGAHTITTLPNGDIYFNSSGNPALATAGTGDVLTGIITGLLAQEYSPEAAATFGVYIHGRAGEIASKKYGMQAVVASDVIDALGEAYLEIDSAFNMTV